MAPLVRRPATSRGAGGRPGPDAVGRDAARGWRRDALRANRRGGGQPVAQLSQPVQRLLLELAAAFLADADPRGDLRV